MGGKSTTSTQTVKIPPEVLARYNAVNARAEKVAEQPFQQYGGQFVAPLTATQQAGIQATSAGSQMAQPYFQAATGLTMSGIQDVGKLTADQIAQYQNPYTQSVIDPTIKALRQQQGQDLAQQQSQAIKSGGFGGDRAGIARAVMMGQQDLARAQTEGSLRSQAYQQAVQTAAGQQGVTAADLARKMQGGQQIAGLGTGAQQAALAGAQAQLAAGTAEQQTQQADLTAKYQQFLQERGYPFQVAQFLAGIALGTGQASGSTTTTTQPSGFFSDEREKTNIKPLGKGLYAYDYKDDIKRARETGEPMPPKRVGPMAQDIEKKAPGLVVDVDDYKVVRNPDSMGGSVYEPGHYASGGSISPDDMRSILAAIGQPIGVYGGQNPMGGGTPGVTSIVPSVNLPAGRMMLPAALPQQRPSGVSQAAETGKQIANLYKMGKQGLVGGIEDGKKFSGFFGTGGEFNKEGWLSRLGRDNSATGGLIVNRHHYLGGGPAKKEESVLPYGEDAMSGNQDILKNVIEAGAQDAQSIKTPGGMTTPGGGGGSGSGLGQVAGLLGSGVSAAKGLGSIGTGLSGLTSALGGGAAAAGTGAAAAGGIGSALGSIGSGFAQVLPFLAMLSDERMKRNKEQVGELYDGQPVYRYDFGDGRTQLGLMAQDVERRHPEAVEEHRGLKFVDYHQATDDAAHRDGYQSGGAKRSGSGLSEDFDLRDSTDADRIFARNIPSQKQPSLIPLEIMLEPGLGLRGRYLQADKFSDIGAGLQFPIGRGRGEIDANYGFVRGAPQAPTQKSIMGRYVLPFADGGEVPRDGYQAGGPPDEPDSRLIESESGGNFGAKNEEVGSGGLRGHFGRLQFGQARLQDAIRAGALPEGTTPEEFRRSPDLQRAVEKWHFGDIRNFIQEKGLGRAVGTEIGGTPVTEQGLLNVAHLGGKGGMQRFVESEGRYDPADKFGTRLSKYLGLGVNGDLPAKGAREAKFSEEGAEKAPEKGLSLKGIGEKATSSDFLVPFLSFVGSALASQRPTLGGALGEGIVGGVAGYQQNREIQAKLAKGVLDLIKDRFTRSTDDNGQTVWFDKYTGKRASPDQIESVYAESLRARGVDPKSFGLGTGFSAPPAITPPGAPTAPTAPGTKPAEGAPGEKTAEGTPGQKAQGSKSWMETPPDKVNLIGKSQTQIEEYVERYADYYGLTGDRNPATMRAEIAADKKRAKALSSTGDADQMREAQALRATAEEKQKRLDTYLKESAALQVGINAETAKAETQSIGKRNEEVDKREASYTTARANFVRLADIFSKYSGGRLADAQAALESYMKDTIGYVPDFLKGKTPNYDEAMKLALRQAFEIVGEGNLSRAPKASLTEAIQTVPNPSQDPGAVYSLIGRYIGEMDYLMAKDKAWLATNGSVRPGRFEATYRTDNPDAYNTAVRNAFSEIPVGAKVPKATLESLQKSYGNFTPGTGGARVAEQAPREGATQPAAPAAPVTVRSVEEARQLPSGTVFIDPNGITRRVP